MDESLLPLTPCSKPVRSHEISTNTDVSRRDVYVLRSVEVRVCVCVGGGGWGGEGGIGELSRQAGARFKQIMLQVNTQKVKSKSHVSW